MCLTNKDVETQLTLGFAFRADSDLMNNGEIATEENVKSMIQIANELTQVKRALFWSVSFFVSVLSLPLSCSSHIKTCLVVGFGLATWSSGVYYYYDWPYIYIAIVCILDSNHLICITHIPYVFFSINNNSFYRSSCVLEKRYIGQLWLEPMIKSYGGVLQKLPSWVACPSGKSFTFALSSRRNDPYNPPKLLIVQIWFKVEI